MHISAIFLRQLDCTPYNFPSNVHFNVLFIDLGVQNREGDSCSHYINNLRSQVKAEHDSYLQEA